MNKHLRQTTPVRVISIEERHALAMSHLKFMEAAAKANAAHAALDAQGAAIFKKYGLNPQRDAVDLDTGVITRGAGEKPAAPKPA